MPYFAKVIFAALLIALAGYCAYAFRATYEPPGYPELRWGYGATCVLSLVAAAKLLFASRAGPPQ